MHPRWHTPVGAILSQGLCAIVMTLTPFRELLTYIGMSLALFSALSVASLLVFRRRQPGWQRLRAVDFLYPLAPAAYIVVSVAMMILALTEHPVASITSLATAGAGALAYHFRLRKSQPE